MANRGKENVKRFAENISKEMAEDAYKELKLQDKTVTPTTEDQDVTADEGYDGLGTVTVEAVTSAIDANIVAENIKKDIEILGITGTYEGSGGTGATYSIETLQEVIPTGLRAMGVTQVGSNIYLFGGNTNGIATNVIYKFNVETETISTLTVTLPHAAFDMGVAQVGSNVYLFGGLGTSTSEYSTTIYKFNAETETISTLTTTLPVGLYCMGVAQVGSNIYLFGGNNTTDFINVNTIYKFDVETETISTLTTTLPTILANMGVAQVGSNVYLFGGNNTTSDELSVNTIYKFNAETETITTLTTTLPTSIYPISLSQFGSNIYLFSGVNTDNFTNVIYKFNAETETITTLTTTLPTILANMGVAQVGSNVYLFGGASLTAQGGINEITKFSVTF